ncbi:integral membrane protein S linking to the trans Golgi network-domain-containing protein [Phyllosticta capitalensis]|uniref:Integral membrane protein S linking to the trans Golgi network-domain-containing protein n=1 Tax=Phyllosticta capitalensis TaxID=121624 RepID=A0ABR1YYG2_9PEZI
MPRRRRPPRPGALADVAPLRILTQILLLQLAYYVSAAILIIFTALVAGKDVSIDLLLSWRSVRGDVTVGWMLGLVWMLNSLICVIYLLLLVARSKLIPDFALTIHFIHLLVTSLYSHSIPSHWLWWAVQLASAALMTFLGIWSCQWRELRPINFGGGGGPSRSRNKAATAQDGIQDDGNASFGRGRGRGRGQYEMIPIQEADETV